LSYLSNWDATQNTSELDDIDYDTPVSSIDIVTLVRAYTGEVPFVYPGGFLTFWIQIELLEIQDRRIRGTTTVTDENGVEFANDDFSAILLPGLLIRGITNLSIVVGQITFKGGQPANKATLISTASRYEEWPPVPELPTLFPAAGYLTSIKEVYWFEPSLLKVILKITVSVGFLELYPPSLEGYCEIHSVALGGLRAIPNRMSNLSIGL
jgi:hypothetical protein